MDIKIPYGLHHVTTDDISEVLNVLNSETLTQGPVVPHFEQAVRDIVGARFAVAANSATSALHVAVASLDLGPGDTLWTSPISFVASANCALYCGADVDFVDINASTLNICPEKLRIKLEAAKTVEKLPKVLVAVHFGGQSCEMDKIFELSREYNFKVVEDASHAIGAKFKGTYVGSCTFSDVAVFSFHPVKIVTSAEGGMALTNCEKLAQKMRKLRTHGIDKSDREGAICEGDWWYQQTELGYNYRMSDLHAALGRSQLSRLNYYIKKRNELAARYTEHLTDLPLKFQSIHSDCISAYHLYVIQLDSKRCRKSRLEVFNFLRNQGIGVNVHYIPIYKHPYYRSRFGEIYLKNSEKYYKNAITLPLYPSLSTCEQDYVIEKLKVCLIGG